MRVPAQAHACTNALGGKGCTEPGWEGDVQLPRSWPRGNWQAHVDKPLGILQVQALCSLKISLTSFVKSQKPTVESADA